MRNGFEDEGAKETLVHHFSVDDGATVEPPIVVLAPDAKPERPDLTDAHHFDLKEVKAQKKPQDPKRYV